MMDPLVTTFSWPLRDAADAVNVFARRYQERAKRRKVAL